MPTSSSSRNGVSCRLVLAALLFVVLLVRADEPTADDKQDKKKEKVLPQETVVVTASRHEESTFDEAEAVTAVGKLELSERMPRTPAEALRYKPGIWVQKTGHLGGAPIIRGFIGNKVLYLFDGIRQNTAGAFAGPNSNLQNIDVLDVDRIEVVRGPGSVLYGSDAIGGVVNVISNEQPVFTPKLELGGRTYGRVASADSETSARQELYVSSPDLYVFGGVTSRDIDDLRIGGGREAEPSDSREFSWDLQLDYRLTPDDRVELFVQDFSRPFGSRYDRPNWKQQNDRQLYGARYVRDGAGPIDKLELNAYYHDQHDFIDEKYWDSDTQAKTWGGGAQATSLFGDGHSLIYGVDYHQDHITKSDPQGHTEDPDVDWYNPAVYALSEWQLTERLRLDVGLRWDYFELQSEAPSLGSLPTPVRDAINNNSFSLSDLNLDEESNALTGGVGLVYSVTEELNWVAHVGRAFRAPNKSDMLSFGQFTQGFGVPAGKLDPETSWTFETGPKVASRDFSGALTGFYTVIENPIVQVESTFNGSDYIDVNGNHTKDAGEQVYKKQNSDGSLKVYGIEAEAMWYLPETFTRRLLSVGDVSVQGNVTWIDATATGHDELLGNANGTIPFNGFVALRWENSRLKTERTTWAQVELAMVDRFTDATASDLSSDPAFRQDPQNGSSPLLRSDGSIPGYSVINLRLGHKLTKQATFTLSVENLTDKKYRDAYSRIDAPGINVVAGLEIRF